MGEISQEQYDMLKDIPKDERSKFVAAFEKLEKDTAKDYRKYVAIALEKFKALNDIKEKDIIEIAFDAIWLDKEVSNLQVTENIRFSCKRRSFCLRIHRLLSKHSFCSVLLSSKY